MLSLLHKHALQGHVRTLQHSFSDSLDSHVQTPLLSPYKKLHTMHSLDTYSMYKYNVTSKVQKPEMPRQVKLTNKPKSGVDPFNI